MAYLGNKTQAAREAKLLRHNAAMALDGAKAMHANGNLAAAKALKAQAAQLIAQAVEFEA